MAEEKIDLVLQPPKKSSQKGKRARTSNEILEGRMAEGQSKYLESALKAWDFEPVDVTDIEAVEERCVWYFRRCVEDDIKPTLQGLANALGVTKRTLMNWVSGESRSETHYKIAQKAYNILLELWEAYMSEGKINPIAGIFLGKNQYGMKDKTEQTVRHEVSVIEEGNLDDVLKLYGGSKPELSQNNDKNGS